jgi:hypothetical protein
MDITKNDGVVKYSNRITVGIQYNILNLPSHIRFADGSSIVYEYAATAVKSVPRIL